MERNPPQMRPAKIRVNRRNLYQSQKLMEFGTRRLGQRYLSEEDSEEETKEFMTEEEALLKKGREIDSRVLDVLKERYNNSDLPIYEQGDSKICVSSTRKEFYGAMKHFAKLKFKDLKVLKLRVIWDTRKNQRDLKFLEGLSSHQVKRLTLDSFKDRNISRVRALPVQAAQTLVQPSVRSSSLPGSSKNIRSSSGGWIVKGKKYKLSPRILKIFSKASNEIELCYFSLGVKDYASVFKYASHCRTVSFMRCSYYFKGLQIDDRINYNISKIKYQDSNGKEFRTPSPEYNYLNPLFEAIVDSPLKNSLKRFVYKNMRLYEHKAKKKFKKFDLKGLIIESQYDTICIESDSEGCYHYSFKV